MADELPGRDLVAKMYGKKFWVVITKAEKPREEIAKHIVEHLHHQIKLEKDGIMFGAGPLTNPDIPPGSLGLIVIRAENETEARRIADSDPLHASGARTYDLYQWTVNEGRITISVDLSDKSFELK